MLNYSGNSFFIVYIFLINCLRIILNAFFFFLKYLTCVLFIFPNIVPFLEWCCHQLIDLTANTIGKWQIF